MKKDTETPPVRPSAPTPLSDKATDAERSAYEQSLYVYEIAKTTYEEHLATYNKNQEEKAKTISNLESEIARLQQELKGGN